MEPWKRKHPYSRIAMVDAFFFSLRILLNKMQFVSLHHWLSSPGFFLRFFLRPIKVSKLQDLERKNNIIKSHCVTFSKSRGTLNLLTDVLWNRGCEYRVASPIQSAGFQ